MRILIAFLLLGVAETALTAPIHVATDGADAAGCGTVSSPCATLQYAYDLAANGDALFVAPGIYREYVRMLRRGVAVSVFGSGTSETVIDGRGLGAALMIDVDIAATVEVADLTLKGSPYGALVATSGPGGVVVVSRCLLTESVSDWGLGNGGGGAHVQGNLVFADSLATGNHSAGEGGGFYSMLGTLTIVNSTVSGNTATGSGGGIFARGTELSVLSSTVAGNVAGTSGGGIDHAAEPIDRFENSILTNNEAPIGPDCTSSLTSTGYNLVGSLADCTLSGNLTGNVVGADPLLGTLADNGGPTFTHALLAGSPALDTGNPAGCRDITGLLPIDQRGRPRPLTPACRCDMGAFELRGGAADAGPDQRIDPGNSALLAGNSCCASPTFSWLEGAVVICPPSADPTCLVSPSTTTDYTLETQCGTETHADTVRVVVGVAPLAIGAFMIHKEGPDLGLTWGVSGDACTYNVYRTQSPGTWPSSPTLSGLTGGGAVMRTLPLGLNLYRVTAVSCEGVEGP